LNISQLPGRKEAEPAKGNPVIMNDMLSVDHNYHEMFKALRAKIEYKTDMVDLRLLAITSAVAGEGKTLTAINLAANMASTGRKKVLLADMDLRKGSVAGMLGIAKTPGMSEYLFGKASRPEILRSTTVPGLFIITAGKTVTSPADILAGDRFRTFLRDIRGEFDLIVLDTPPILPVPDALTISEQVDSFIMIFRLGHTPHQLFRQALEEVGAQKVMGVVLNGAEKKSDRYYSRYYGKYYRKSAPAGNAR